MTLRQPLLRKLLFFLSIFYGLGIEFISTYSAFEIDKEAKTFTIDFQDLQAPASEMDSLSQYFAKLDTGKNMLAQTGDFKLDTLYLYQEQDEVNALMKFEFGNEQNLYEMLNIDRDKKGNLYMVPLELEKVKSTNGMDSKAASGEKIVIWKNEIQVIRMKLKRKPYAKEDKLSSTKSLLPAWEKWKESKE